MAEQTTSGAHRKQQSLLLPVQARGVTGPDPTAPHARLGISNFYILSGGGMRWEMGTHPGHAVLLKGERWPRTGRGTLAPCLPARLLLK